ncbi:hypothetical protein SFRURICE_010240 [Spodoptera frugiperda]|nr:hypothetical protein SFRURICE_010240 [Spodoptera frugiperda]
MITVNWTLTRYMFLYWDKPATTSQNRCNSCKPGSTVDFFIFIFLYVSPIIPIYSRYNHENTRILKSGASQTHESWIP